MSNQQSIISQLTFRRARLTQSSEYSNDPVFHNAKECSSIKSNLMCSDVEDSSWAHKLILDLDFPIEVYESSSGNNHLMFPQDLSFEAMIEILEVLQKHRIVQKGWVDGAKKAGYASLRPPGVDKGVQENNYGLDGEGNVESYKEYMDAAREARQNMSIGGITPINATFAPGGVIASNNAFGTDLIDTRRM